MIHMKHSSVGVQVYQCLCMCSCTHLRGSHSSFLQTPDVNGTAHGRVPLLGDEEGIEEDVAGHGPQLQAHGVEGGHPEGMEVLKEVRIGNLPGLPHTLGKERWRYIESRVHCTVSITIMLGFEVWTLGFVCNDSSVEKKRKKKGRTFS